jgi:dTDP-4-amino-4,6-dideoxygalactose transaminase
MPSIQVPFARPYFDQEEKDRVLATIESGWVSQGAQVEEFEHLVASFVGAREAVATNSCTTALVMALRLSGIGEGDSVICPSFTCMATANSILAVGARPILAEIEAETFNLDPEDAGARIGSGTKAILGVDQLGLPANWNALAALAERHQLVLIEDAGCALGAEYRGKRVGQLGWPTAFSFHPRKIVATGEGGMLVLDDTAMASRARAFRSHGASVSDVERHKAGGALVAEYPEAGCNFRMTDLQGSLGVAQMKKLAWFRGERERQARRYNEALAEIEEVKIPTVPPFATHAYQSYLVRLQPACKRNRDELMGELIARGVACRHGIAPLHLEPYFRRTDPGRRLPISERVSQTSLFLPIFPGLTEAQQEHVIESLRRALVRG